MFRTVVDIFGNSFKSYTDNVAMQWREGKKLFTKTYGELSDEVDAICVGLLNMGIKPGTHIGLIADVSQGWSTSCISIQMCGCVDVPRGTDSTGTDLAYILSHSESKIVFAADSKEVDKIETALNKEKHKVSQYIVIDNSISKKNKKKCLKLSDVIESGKKLIQKESKECKELSKIRKNVKSEELCTIIYTSGTTGEPKGVQLMHANLSSQVNILSPSLDISSNDRALTLLPPWHIFGRILELVMFYAGSTIIYTDIKNIRDDMGKFKPTVLPAVPRIWEGVYNGLVAKVKQGGKEGLFNFFKGMAVKNYKAKATLTGKERLYKKRNILVSLILKLIALLVWIFTLPLKSLGHLLIFRKIIAITGGNLKYSVSGGGALPGYIDEFFAGIGLKILEGYGLTETSPVISVRDPQKPILGTVGCPIDETEIRLIDLDGRDVTHIPNVKGTLHIRGPQVMKGYYKNPKKTKEVLTDDGWFNTGDLVKMSVSGEMSIVGRSKDTIVLLGGENVEPAPIEERIKQSPYIDHVMCVGQDQKAIGALVVPNVDELSVFVEQNKISGKDINDWIQQNEVNSLYRSEISKAVSLETGFKSFEKVSVFKLVSKPFEKGDELNNTLKVLRHVVTDKYQKVIDEMYN